MKAPAADLSFDPEAFLNDGTDFPLAVAFSDDSAAAVGEVYDADMLRGSHAVGAGSLDGNALPVDAVRRDVKIPGVDLHGVLLLDDELTRRRTIGLMTK